MIQGRSHRRILSRAFAPTLDGGGQHREIAVLAHHVLHHISVLGRCFRHLAAKRIEREAPRGSGLRAVTNRVEQLRDSLSGDAVPPTAQTLVSAFEIRRWSPEGFRTRRASESGLPSEQNRKAVSAPE